MPAYKDKKTGKWFVSFYMTNWKGEKKRILKRGFTTKKLALEYEKNYQISFSNSPDMTFEQFAEKYLEDVKPILKESTYDNRENIVKGKLTPVFGKKRLIDITKSDIKNWQNELILSTDPKNDTPYKSSYVKAIKTVLTNMLNHAVENYGLPKNYALDVKGIKYQYDREVDFWTYEEFSKFIATLSSRPEECLAFEILYWTGIREGELLALTPNDIDFEKKELIINKTYHRAHGRDIITSPKTQKSNRRILLPDDLWTDLRIYFSLQYKLDQTERIFTFSKDTLLRTLSYGAKRADVKTIRVHDLRHSHVSLLINMGFTAIAIADRLGHETADITLRYAHLFPSTQREIVHKLNAMKG